MAGDESKCEKHSASSSNQNPGLGCDIWQPAAKTNFNSHVKTTAANETGTAVVDSSGTLLALKLDSPFKLAAPKDLGARDQGARNGTHLTDIKGLVDYIKTNFATIDTDGNHLIDKLEIEKAITDPKLDSNQALAAAFLYYYRNSLAKDSATLSADGLNALTKPDFEAKAQRTLDKLIKKEQLGPNLFPEQSITPESIIQGAFGDCKFVSTLSAFAAKPDSDEKLRQMIQSNPDGSYTVKFPGDLGHPVKVGALTLGEKMIGSSSSDDAMFVSVLEKAYGQYRNDKRTSLDGALNGIIETGKNALHEGRFSPNSLIKAEAANDGDRDNDAMKLLTGRDSETVSLPKNNPGYNHLLAAIAQPAEVEIANALKNHKAVTLGLNPGDPSLVFATIPGENGAASERKAITVHANHSYSVIGYDHNLVTIYDAHGSLSGKDNEFLPGTNGKFQIRLDQLKYYFSGVSIED